MIETERIKVIMEALSEISETGLIAFKWYLAMDCLQTALVSSVFIVLITCTYRLVRYWQKSEF